MAPQDEIAKFRGKYKIGWDQLREQRHARQIELGVVDKAWALSPRPPAVKAWDTSHAGRAGPLRSHHGHLRGGRGAHGHGRGPARRGPQRARRARQHADPVPLRQRRQRRERPQRPAGRRPARRGRLDGLRGAIVGHALEHAAPPLQAFQPRRRHRHAADRPLAGRHHRRPANCASSPATSWTSWPPAWTWPARSTRRSSTAKPILPMEGKSLVPAFANQPIQRDALYWEHEGNAAVRVGDWKLVRLARNGPWELYNLKTDRTELLTTWPAPSRNAPASWPRNGTPGPSGRARQAVSESQPAASVPKPGKSTMIPTWTPWPEGGVASVSAKHRHTSTQKEKGSWQSLAAWCGIKPAPLPP